MWDIIPAVEGLTTLPHGAKSFFKERDNLKLTSLLPLSLCLITSSPARASCSLFYSVNTVGHWLVGETITSWHICNSTAEFESSYNYSCISWCFCHKRQLTWALCPFWSDMRCWWRLHWCDNKEVGNRAALIDPSNVTEIMIISTCTSFYLLRLSCWSGAVMPFLSNVVTM